MQSGSKLNAKFGAHQGLIFFLFETPYCSSMRCERVFLWELQNAVDPVLVVKNEEFTNSNKKLKTNRNRRKTKLAAYLY